MQQIISFFIKNKNFLLFAFLFFISIVITIQSHSYHNSKIVSSTNVFSGGIYTIKSNITQYFDLKEQNNILLEENSRLRSLTKIPKATPSKMTLDSTLLNNYTFVDARIINNVYSKKNNYLTINKGNKDSIKQDMGVISSKGLVGVVNKVSNNYGRIQSILNSKSQINAQLKKNNQYGFLLWNGENPNLVQLTEIPKLAPIAVGDTIVTGGNSSIFPKGILIGIISNFSITEEDTYMIDVALFNDMTNLSHVYVIKNKNKKEIEQLEIIEDAE